MAKQDAIKKVFFTRARTRSLSRWGVISILAAFTVLAVNLMDDVPPPVIRIAEARTRAELAEDIKPLPSFSFYYDTNRNLFVFKDPPKPKVVEAEPVKQVVVAPTPPESEKEPEPPTVDTSGLSLKGVVADAGGGGWAIVSGLGRNDKVLRRGDKVRGAVVDRIESQRVVIKSGDRVGEIKLVSTFRPFVSQRNVKKKDVKEEKSAPVKTEGIKQRRSLGISVRRKPGGGVVVTSVRRGDIDVRVGDVLVAVDGSTVSSLSGAVSSIRNAKSNPSIQLRLKRGDRVFNVKVPLEE